MECSEVLHGVGADGVGVKFPTSAVNCCCLPLSFRRKNEEKQKKTKKCVKKRKMHKKGENHADPIYTNPIKNLPRMNPTSHNNRQETINKHPPHQKDLAVPKRLRDYKI